MSDSVSSNIFTLFSFDSEYSADSVEWCPHKPNENVFVCANYQIIEASEQTPIKRVGRILLFSITADGLKLHQTINTAAVLDQKWCHNKVYENSLLGVVNALKVIEIYQLNKDKLQINLVASFEIVDDESETLILSLDWSTGLTETNEPEIICSDSKGNVHLLKLMNNNLILQNSWHGHDFEAWIAAFYYWDTNIFFSGGDDCIFFKFDKRVGNKAVAKNKSHHAGVTSLHSNRFKENILASGSYDEHIRVWDIRNMKSEINSVKMPGTIWRVKWDPFGQGYLLAACMLGGVHIIDAIDIGKLEIIGSFYEHKNIAYGADWSYLNSDSCKCFDADANTIIGTCSFYDHLLCISKFTFPKP